MEKSTLYFLLFILLISCRPGDSSHSEEESAYMADYEPPAAKWGFINRQGELVIDAQYDDVGPFSEGLACVNKNGKWGYIDQQGNEIIEPVYKSAWAFHEGFARVLAFDEKGRFINRNGKELTNEEWSAADDFSDGRARVTVGDYFGYIDTSGTLVVQPIYSRGWNFTNDRCIIEYDEKLGVINKDGDEVLKPEFEQIKRAAIDKIFLCKKGNDSYAYDKEGQLLIKHSKSKMIDSNGEVISIREGNVMYLIKLSDPSSRSSSFANIVYLEENRWAAKTDSGYVLTDSEAKRLNDQYYNQLNKYSDGFAAYNKGEYWGYLDLHGNELTGEVFGLTWDYKEGLARAAFKEGIAFIDKSQKLAFYPPRGSLDMRDFSEGLAAIQLE